MENMKKKHWRRYEKAGFILFINRNAAGEYELRRTTEKESILCCALTAEEADKIEKEMAKNIVNAISRHGY